MQKLNLQLQKHEVKIGQECPYYEPNIKEDTLFMFEGKSVGFYLKKVEGKIAKLLEIANTELLSDRVPKTKLDRMSKISQKSAQKEVIEKYKDKKGFEVDQYSTIIGSIPPKPVVKRTYPTISSVHQVKTATNFIKAMLLVEKEGEKLLKEIMPEQYELQKQILAKTDPKWRFGDLFTSSISNFNINANYHRDTGNLQNTVNFIFTKRNNSTGGCLNVPDFGITVEQADNSLLVYPAWQNIHGVTPIIPTGEGGYRNSLVFYPLKAFENLK